THEQRDQKESEHELWKLVPQKRSFIGDGAGLSTLRPVDRVGENDEADHGIARGLGKHGDFSGSIRVERAGGSSFGGIIDPKAGPQAEHIIAEMEAVAD